ncbi:hypothetical protein BKA82DRAFT_3988394, partial [Pisolithus tinctorius]
AVRILGAWLGNKVNKPSVWSLILEKLESCLWKWNTHNPLIKGRRMITPESADFDQAMW